MRAQDEGYVELFTIGIEVTEIFVFEVTEGKKANDRRDRRLPTILQTAVITPDLLHQLIKGVFKDHLVEWVCEYLRHEHGKAKANSILDEIDRR